MKRTFEVTATISRDVEALNEEEAEEKFWIELEEENTTLEAELSENMEVKQVE